MFWLTPGNRLRQRILELEARLDALELRFGEDRLGVLELMEKITYRLTERNRNRGRANRASREEEEPELDVEGDHALGYERRFNRSRGGEVD